MLNVIWPVFIIVSCIYGIFVGRANEINSSIFSSAEDAVKLIITFFGTICVWNGIMQIASSTMLMERLKKRITPIVSFLFPELNIYGEEFKHISMNIVANLLGLGNAATPIGLKAMQEIQKTNPKKDTLSNSMIMLIVINTASMQLVPTTIIAIRGNLGATNPTDIIVPIWIASISAVITVVFVTKLLTKLGR